MTVVEALLGEAGTQNYWFLPRIGREISWRQLRYGDVVIFGYKGERLDNMKKWPQTWPAEINDKSQSSGGASAEGFMFGDMPTL